MVFLGPIEHRIHQIFTHHRPFTGQIVAAARPIGYIAVGPAAVPVAGHGTFQPTVGVVGVVVDHIHHHAQPGPVQRLDHGAAFPYPHRPVESIGGKGAFRHVVVQRIVPPVVPVGAGLIHRGIIKDRL